MFKRTTAVDSHFNLFDVLKISKTEIRHSNMLGWLLNPNENHGMGDAFLKAVVQEMVVNDTDVRYFPNPPSGFSQLYSIQRVEKHRYLSDFRSRQIFDCN